MLQSQEWMIVFRGVDGKVTDASFAGMTSRACPASCSLVSQLPHFSSFNITQLLCLKTAYNNVPNCIALWSYIKALSVSFDESCNALTMIYE